MIMMNTKHGNGMLLLLLPITTLYFFFSALLTAAQDPGPAPVLDIHGNQLLAGLKYYILPVIRGRGGGLTLAPPPNNTNTCPLAVLQEHLELLNGLPLTFSPVDNKRIVRLSTDNNIKFSASSISCVQSTIWKLDSYDESTRKYLITSGGVSGNPGPQTISNWFKIEKLGVGSDYNYKLVFCPTVCNFCKVICKDIGIFIQDGMRRLALTDDQPFPVFFKKAP